MRYNRTSKALVLSAALALTLTACGGGGGNNNAGDNSGGDSSKVITANSTEPQNGLLPANTNEVGGGRVMDLLFTGLVSYDTNGKPVNELAESIETKDAKLYTIKIKSGQKFTNGEPVTAKSFVDAWNFGAAAKNAQLNSYFFESIKGYDKVSAKDATADNHGGPEGRRRHHLHRRTEQPRVRLPAAPGLHRLLPAAGSGLRGSEGLRRKAGRQRPVQVGRGRLEAQRPDRPGSERRLQRSAQGRQRRRDVQDLQHLRCRIPGPAGRQPRRAGPDPAAAHCRTSRPTWATAGSTRPTPATPP